MTPSPSSALHELETQSSKFVDGDPRQSREALALDVELVDEAIREAFEAGHLTRDPNWALSVLDQTKSMITRNYLAKHRMQHVLPASVQGLVIFTRSQPRLLSDYMEQVAPEDSAVCNLYMTRHGEVWSALTTKGIGPPRTSVRRIIAPEQAPLLLETLNEYVATLVRGAPDQHVLDRILRLVGREFLAHVIGAVYPEHLLLIPHKSLHLIPWHACYLPGSSGSRTYLADLAPKISYASSIYEALWAEVWFDESPSYADARRLRVFDLSVKDLIWLEREHTWELYGGSYPIPTDIVTVPEDLPESMQPYRRIGWSGHASSSPNGWASSCLHLGDSSIKAHDVMEQWRLQRGSVVVLAACETAVDSSAPPNSDEYCGLDLAFRIAGASAVVSTQWRVADAVAALAGMLIETYEWNDRISTRASLGLFQRFLRTGEWKQHLMREDQMDDSVPRTVRRVLIDLHREDAREFQDVRHWACFRCLASR